MTGYGSDEDRRRCLEAGFDRHLLQPMDLDAALGNPAGIGDISLVPGP